MLTSLVQKVGALLAQLVVVLAAATANSRTRDELRDGNGALTWDLPSVECSRVRKIPVASSRHTSGLAVLQGMGMMGMRMGGMVRIEPLRTAPHRWRCVVWTAVIVTVAYVELARLHRG